MLRTRIKFCGLTRLEDALKGVELGVDALGFVLAPGSPRFLSPQAAAAIRRELPPLVTAVALLRDADRQAVQEAVDILKPDLLQFHGAETAEFCASFGLPYIKAVAMGGAHRPLEQLVRDYAGASGLLLDGHAPGEMGGQGQAFDWNTIGRLAKPVILAGGLTPQNVAQAIRIARPYAVDVSSGIEAAPGIKDSGKMEAFARQVRGADLQAAY